MVDLKDINDTIDKIPEAVKGVKQSSRTYLGFLAVIVLGLVFGVIIISCFSKLPLMVNVGIILLFLSLIFLLLFGTYKLAKGKPWTLLFDQEAYLTMYREQLSDSISNKPYDGNISEALNIEAPKQLEDKKSNSPK